MKVKGLELGGDWWLGFGVQGLKVKGLEFRGLKVKGFGIRVLAVRGWSSGG